MEDRSVAKTPTAKEPPPKAAGEVPERDLSREIERAIDRQPLDTVRCVRVFGDFYRCNWWSRTTVPHRATDFDWSRTMTDTIRASRFLTANMHDGALVIQEVHG